MLQSWSGHGGEEKNSQHLPRFEPPIIKPAVQRYTTELSRLILKKVGNIKKECACHGYTCS
jgi:hypothetical protein